MSAAPNPPEIAITPCGGDELDVEVRARSATRHRVIAAREYLDQIAGPGCPAALVVREAFVFLLERESNTSILRSFRLEEIERYFPEFRAEIGKRLRV